MKLKGIIGLVNRCDPTLRPESRGGVGVFFKQDRNRAELSHLQGIAQAGDTTPNNQEIELLHPSTILLSGLVIQLST
jgi:hypothetical protein